MADKSLLIRALRSDDGAIIDFIEDRLETRWKMKKEKIREAYIRPALTSQKLPCIFIAELKGIFVGKIFLIIEAEGALRIHDQPWLTALYVEEKYRNHGIGRALIDHAKRIAKEYGYEYLYLDTAEAQSYYLHIGGWEILGREYWEEGEKEIIVMRSKL